MRSQAFLDRMSNYNFGKAKAIANWHDLRGGWEVWMQVEIAAHMSTFQGFQRLEREVPYPAPPAQGGERCDFKIVMTERLQTDDTYIELKCINPNTANPLADIDRRFRDDFAKIERLRSANYSCFALCAVYGRLGPARDNKEPIIVLGQEILKLRQYANIAYKSVYVLVPGSRAVPIKADTTLAAADRADNLYLIAVADTR